MKKSFPNILFIVLIAFTTNLQAQGSVEANEQNKNGGLEVKDERNASSAAQRKVREEKADAAREKKEGVSSAHKANEDRMNARQQSSSSTSQANSSRERTRTGKNLTEADRAEKREKARQTIQEGQKNNSDH